MKRRVHIIITGKVQGVFFRRETRFFANTHSLLGWVQNKPDGTVEIVAEGMDDKLKDLIRWCWRGPQQAVVEHVKNSWSRATGEFTKFERKN
jgi:acylphosphatase